VTTIPEVSWYREIVSVDPPVIRASISTEGAVCTGGSLFAENSQEVVIHRLAAPSMVMRAPGDRSYVGFDGKILMPAEGCRAHRPASIVWDPTGRYVVTGSGNPERALRLYDAGNGVYRVWFGEHGGDLYNLAWSPDGRRIASASTWPYHELKIWNCEWGVPGPRVFDDPGQLLLWPPGDDPEILTISQEAVLDRIHDYLPWWKHEWLSPSDFYGFGAMCFSPDSDWLAVVIYLRTGKNRLAVYSLPDFDDCYSYVLPTERYIADLCWDPSGMYVFGASSEGGMVVVGPVTDSAPSGVKSLAVNADRCATNPNRPLVAVSARQQDSKEVTCQDVDLLPIHAIRIVVLPTLSPVAEFRGCARVRELTWSRDGSDLFAVTQGAERIRGRLWPA
jgi:WD40 repeat protein